MQLDRITSDGVNSMNCHTPSTSRFIAGLLTLLLVGLSLVAGGCQSSGAGRAGDRDLDQALALYDQGSYDNAYRLATEAYYRASGKQKERAALIAGLSSYAQHSSSARPEEVLLQAEQWLRPITDSSTSEVSGRALATLGLIEVARGDHASAVNRLVAASRKLHGNESARASFFAAESFAALGRWDSANIQYRVAQASASDPELRRKILERLQDAGYTVQIGAYSTEGNAQSAAASVGTRAARLGLGQPRIVPFVDATDRRLWLVHVGSFSTERDAENAKVQLGVRAIVRRELAEP